MLNNDKYQDKKKIPANQAEMKHLKFKTFDNNKKETSQALIIMMNDDDLPYLFSMNIFLNILLAILKIQKFHTMQKKEKQKQKRRKSYLYNIIRNH